MGHYDNDDDDDPPPPMPPYGTRDWFVIQSTTIKLCYLFDTLTKIEKALNDVIDKQR